MLEKLLSNEENLTDGVDSMFEEPGSFKQQLNDDYYPSEQQKIDTLTDQMSKKKCIYHKSASLPNLTSLNELNEPAAEHHVLNRTVDGTGIDQVDASFKKMLTKRIKRCVSQLLNKSPNSEIAYTNRYFDEEEQPYDDYSDPHESYYHHQPQISQPIRSHPYSSPRQCGRPHYLNIGEPQQHSHSPLAPSQQSTSVTGSGSSVESFESPNLALNAKGSNYISALAKQLLHKLFVSISGRIDNEIEYVFNFKYT